MKAAAQPTIVNRKRLVLGLLQIAGAGFALGLLYGGAHQSAFAVAMLTTVLCTFSLWLKLRDHHIREDALPRTSGHNRRRDD